MNKPHSLINPGMRTRVCRTGWVNITTCKRDVRPGLAIRAPTLRRDRPRILLVRVVRRRHQQHAPDDVGGGDALRACV